MKIKPFLLLVSITLIFASCKKAVVTRDLKKTTWYENGGSSTFEFQKKQVLYNGVELRGKGECIYVQDGQIWTEKKDVKSYLFDYKLSGNNLFISVELTDAFYDPSSPSYAGIKYNP